MAQNDRRLYAVLIDADNISADHAEVIMKEVTAFGEPALRRVYGDWSNGSLKEWPKQIKALGLVAHQATANTVGKNATDIALAIDAMDILYTGRFDGFVIVSSDSDYTQLVSRIREEGLDVIGIGEKEKAAISLRNVCNRFILVENLIEQPKKAVGQSSTVAAKKISATKAVPIIVRAMDKINTDDDWYYLGQLGQFITAANPDFDARTYGEKKLTDLVLKLSQFETRKRGNQLLVKRPPQTP